jgi:hypothetical protein
MPNPKQFTIDQELQFFTELENINMRNERFRQLITPDLARNVSNLGYTAPRAPKEVLMAAGRALTDNLITPQQADDIVSQTERKVLTSPLTYKFKDPNTIGSVWDNLFEGMKTTAKWGIAGLQSTADLAITAGGAAVGGAINLANLPKEVTRNVLETGSVVPTRYSEQPTGTAAAEYLGVPDLPGSELLLRNAVYTPPSLMDADFGTVFRSTEIGALLSGADSGNGWFIGGEAKRLQMENRAKLTGTIDGAPITPGRGLALTVSTPGTKPYAIISALVDLGIEIAVPAPTAGLGRATGKLTTGLADVDIAPLLRPFGKVEPGEVRPLLRSVAGLTNYSAPFVVRDKVAQFLDSTMGRYVMQRLANTTDYEEVARLFPKTDINFRQAVVDAGEDTIRDVLEEGLGIARGTMNVQDFNLGRLSDVREAMLNNNVARWSGAERLFADRAGREIAIITDDPRTATRSVENLTNYLISLRVAPARRKELINKLSDTLVNNADNTKVVMNEIKDEVITQLAAQRKLSREMLDSMFTRFTETKDQYVLFGQVGADDMPMMFSLGDVRQALMPGKSATGQSGFYLIPGGTAMNSAEMRRVSMFLPDPDRVYRATSKFSWLFETWSRDPKKFGNPNKSVLFIDWVNSVWRQAITMTGGYIQRNLLESAVRASLAPGIKAGPLNPIEHILTSIHTNGFGKYLGDVEGVPFTEYGQAAIYREFDDWKDAVEATIRENISSELIEKRAGQTGAWQLVAKTQEGLYPQMLMDNIQLLASDELFRMVARGMTTDQIMYEILQKTPETQVALKNLQRLHSNIRMQNVYTGQYEKATIDYIDEVGNINQTTVRNYIDKYVRPRVGYNTGGTRRPDGTYALDGDARLLELIANGDQLGRFTYNGKIVDGFKTSQLGPAGELVSVDYSDDFKAVINEIINDPVMGPRMPIKGKARINVESEGAMAIGQKVGDSWRNFSTGFFSNLFGKPDAFLNRSPVWRQYYYRKIDDLLDDLAPGEAAQLRRSVLSGYAYNAKEDFRKLLAMRPDGSGLYQYGAKQITENEYFDMLAGRLRKLGFDKTETATRIGALRQARNVPKNWRNESGLLQTEIRIRVMGNERFGARWVGSKELWKKINDKAGGVSPSTGDLTAEQIGQVAKIFAGEATMKTFFDASRKSNFAQVLRIVAPFGPAWAEQMRAFSRALTQSPEDLKNAAVLMDNTRSFFYNDPVTGEPYFNYGPTEIALPIIFAMLGLAGGVGLGASGMLPAAVPTIIPALGGAAGGAFAGSQVSGAVSEVMPQLRGPARSLSMAFNVLPGVGPFVQIPANQILNRGLADVKSLDFAREFLMPYGATEGIVASFTPAWVRKFSQAITQDPETDTLFAQLSMDSFVALMASGKYDRQNGEDVSRAWDKARSIGSWLTIAQAAGQLVGPARPGIALKIPTQFEGELSIGDVEQIIKDGDVTNITLSRVFRLLQEQDFDSAPQKFIEMFGENAIYLMAGRTTTDLSGLQASKEFGDWEQANSGFAETHRDVFGWFAPIGSTFDKQAYISQLQRGLRERRDDPFLLVEDVEFIVGSSMYRQYQKELGADGEVTPTDKAKLKVYRQRLEEYFPGYRLRDQITNRTATAIDRTITAANDSRVEGNPVAEAVKTYNEYRTWALESAQARRQVAGRAPAISNILDGDANADLRAYLRDIGERIIQNTPEFSRVYDAVFYYEIDEVG